MGSGDGERWGVQIMELARAGKVGLICSKPCLDTRERYSVINNVLDIPQVTSPVLSEHDVPYNE